MEIGFSHGIPENLDKTWKSEINGRTFTFEKKRVSRTVFLYNCSMVSEGDRFIGSSSTGFHSDRNLTPEEVERLPQFADFIAGSERFA